MSAVSTAIARFFKWLDANAVVNPSLIGLVVNILSTVIVGTVVFIFRNPLINAGKALLKLGAAEGTPATGAANPAEPSSSPPPPVVVVRVEGAAVTPAATTTNPKPSNLPGSIGTLFKGRDAFLERLRKRFEQHDAAAITAKAVYGLGGLGKTRAAIEYAHAHADSYGATLFLTGRSASGLRDRLADLAGAAVLNLPEKDIPDLDARAGAVIGWLRAHPGWLLIIDNVDDPDAAAAAGALLDQVGGAGHVLITSRIGSWAHKVEAIDLDLLSVDAAKELLRASTPNRTKRDDEDEALTRLADAQLGCLSLALMQAAAYIDKKHIGFAEYSALFEEKSKALLAKLDPAAVLNLGYEFPVAATWQASFAQLSEAGRLLLDMLAWLSIEPIPRSLFDVWPDADIDLEEALDELVLYSLVHWEEGNGAITLHRLVAQVTRDNLDKARRDRALEALFLWIYVVNPEMNAVDVRCWPKLLPLLSHVLLLFERTCDYGPYSYQANVYNEYATLLRSLARYTEAEPLCRRALAIDEERHGPDHPAVAIDVLILAKLCLSTDRLEEAEPLLRRALVIDESYYGSDDPAVATVLNDLAVLLRTTNRLVEAEPLYRRALAIYEASKGPDHPWVASGLSNLAGLLEDTDRQVEAEPLYRRALAIDEASLGADHPNVAIRLNNLGGLLLDTDRLAEAEPFSRRATLILLRSSKASEHLLPNAVTAVRNYAKMLERSNKAPHDALPLIEAVMREAGFDPNTLWPQIFGDEARSQSLP